VKNDAPGMETAASAVIIVKNPQRRRILATFEKPVNIAYGQAVQVPYTFQYSWYFYSGIWHTSVELYDADGNLIRPERDNMAGRFIVAEQGRARDAE